MPCVDPCRHVVAAYGPPPPTKSRSAVSPKLDLSRRPCHLGHSLFEHLSDSLNLIKKKEVQEAGTHRRITKCRGRQQFHFASRAQRRAQSAYPSKASVAGLAVPTHRAPGSRCQKLDRQTPGMLELSPCRPRKFWCYVRHFLEFDRVRQVVVVLSR